MRRFWLVPVIALVVCVGCVKEDADRLQRVANRSANEINVVSGNAWGRLAPRWQRVRATPEQTLEDRVRQRLANDKSLASARIEAKATGATVELRGTQITAEQRKQALALTQATVGVEQVVDQMTD